MKETSELLSLYQGLRVTDVCDGLDAIGLIDACTMDWEIRPSYRRVHFLWPPLPVPFLVIGSKRSTHAMVFLHGEQAWLALQSGECAGRVFL